MRLKDKVVVVTGASSGMGKAIVETFAKEGATVIAVARRAERLDELVDSLKASNGKVIAFPGDISGKEINEGMIEKAVEVGGKIDILINNAGIMDEMTPIGEVTDELWEHVLAVNLNGPMYACRKAVQIMKEQGYGNIINVASVGGLQGSRAGACYTSSKFALVGLTKNIAFMYAKSGIRCNAICPGGVDTEISVNISKPSEFGMGRVMTGVASAPRNGSAQEVANIALFLANDESSLVNGATITADAGWLAF